MLLRMLRVMVCLDSIDEGMWNVVRGCLVVGNKPRREGGNRGGRRIEREGTGGEG